MGRFGSREVEISEGDPGSLVGINQNLTDKTDRSLSPLWQMCILAFWHFAFAFFENPQNVDPTNVVKPHLFTNGGPFSLPTPDPCLPSLFGFPGPMQVF